MTEKNEKNKGDIAVGAIGAFKEVVSSMAIPGLPTGPGVKMIPSYLVTLEPDLTSKKSYRFFVAIEQPVFLPDHIHAKGFFSDSSEDDIVTGYKEMVAAATQAQVLEMWFPWHTIHNVRSLVFKTASKK
jgi:hypothetical protein